MSPASLAIPIINKQLMAGTCLNVTRSFSDNPKLFRDRLCKALQDRGTSPGLEGSSDSRSARVSLCGNQHSNLQFWSQGEQRERRVQHPTLELLQAQYNRGEIILLDSSPAKCAFAGHQSNGAVLFEEEE